MNTIQSLNAKADAEAKKRTPSVVYPSTGGLKNPEFQYRRNQDVNWTRLRALGDHATGAGRKLVP